jgi:hypothetical protein
MFVHGIEYLELREQKSASSADRDPHGVESITIASRERELELQLQLIVARMRVRSNVDRTSLQLWWSNS